MEPMQAAELVAPMVQLTLPVFTQWVQLMLVL